jgi:hypothetical protein
VTEKQHLGSYTPLSIEDKEIKMHNVRKTNVIAYKSNFYTVPMGTYQNSDSKVIVKESEGVLKIYDLNNKMICDHSICIDKGKTIRNTNHKRDTSKSLDEMMDQTAACFSDKDLATDYLMKIKKVLPRYIRDHLQFIFKELKNVNKTIADKALAFCIKNNNLNGNEFRQVLHVCLDETIGSETDRDLPTGEKEIKLLDKDSLEKANQAPETSNIDDYENILNQ